MDPVKKFCQTKDSSHLPKIFVAKFETSMIPSVLIDKFSIDPFKPEWLDDHRIIFKPQWNNIDHLVSNYDSEPDSILHDCLYDKAWFEQQKNYIRSLNKFQLLTILGYTKKGSDILNKFLINDSAWFSDIQYVLSAEGEAYFPLYVAFLQLIKQYEGKLPAELQSIKTADAISTSNGYKQFVKVKKGLKLSQNFWKDVCKIAVKHLQDIIQKAPPTKNCMTLWRGVKRKYWGTELYTFNFSSTTIDLEMTHSFMDENNRNLMRLNIPAGVNCLFVGALSAFGSESEVILPIGLRFKIDKEKTIPYLFDKSLQPEVMLCVTPDLVHVTSFSLI
jgi:hypothetical protein